MGTSFESSLWSVTVTRVSGSYHYPDAEPDERALLLAVGRFDLYLVFRSAEVYTEVLRQVSVYGGVARARVDLG